MFKTLKQEVNTLTTVKNIIIITKYWTAFFLPLVKAQDNSRQPVKDAVEKADTKTQDTVTKSLCLWSQNERSVSSLRFTMTFLSTSTVCKP